MDALTLIKKHADYDVLLKEFDFKSINSTNKDIRCACGLHGGNNPSAFIVNKDNGLWYCHTGNCGGGDVISLVEKKLNLTFVEAVRWISNRFEIDINGMEIVERTSIQQDELKKFIKATRARKKKEFNNINLPEGKKVISYKGLQRETLETFGVTYHENVTVTNKENKEVELQKRLLFPIIQNNSVVGYGLRRTISTHQPKWFYQPTNIVLGNCLYNFDNINGKNVLYVVEGMTDVMAFEELGLTAVATFGAHMTEQQARMLLRTGAEIVIAYDGDDAGIIARNKALNILNNKADLFYIDFKSNEDPASITREELKEYVRTRKRHIDTGFQNVNRHNERSGSSTYSNRW